MPECSICASGLLDSVNAALEQGRSIRAVAAEFGFPKSTVHRHQTQCIVLAEARRAVTVRRAQEKEALVLQTTQERLAPIDGLARDLMDFISEQVSRGKVPNLSLVKTFLQSAEIALKAQALLETRQATPVASGLAEAGQTVAFLREHFPDALTALAKHLGAQL